MSKLSKRSELLFLLDCFIAVQKVLKYSSNITKEELIKNEEKYDAILRELEIIGESLKNVSQETLNLNKNLDWAPFKGMRDILAHGYFIIDVIEVYNTTKNDIPLLKVELKNLILSYSRNIKLYDSEIKFISETSYLSEIKEVLLK